MSFSLFERLREKPKEVRVQVSFLAALCVTGVVGLLWGVTLPTRLQGFPGSDQSKGTGEQAQSEQNLGSFFTRTRDNIAQIVGGITGESATDTSATSGDVGNTPPQSDAYRVGAPPSEPPGYNDSPIEEPQPVVAPIDRREVRIGTTTSVQSEGDS